MSLEALSEIYFSGVFFMSYTTDIGAIINNATPKHLQK